MRIEDKGDTRYFTFYTWGDWLDYVKGKSEMDDYSRASRQPDDNDWTKTKNWSEAIKLAEEGWEEGAKRIREVGMPIFDKLSQLIEKQHVVYDVTGMELDVATYLKGVPECWMDFETKIERGVGVRHVKITYNYCASWCVSSDVLVGRGAAVAALVELLELAGYRVELWAVEATDPSWGGRGGAGSICRLRNQVLVKSSEQPLDLSRVAFALAHPAMLRRLAFSLMELQDKKTRDAAGVGGGYGMPCDIAKEVQGDLHFAHMHGSDSTWTDMKKTREWVALQLVEQGVTLL